MTAQRKWIKIEIGQAEAKTLPSGLAMKCCPPGKENETIAYYTMVEARRRAAVVHCKATGQWPRRFSIPRFVETPDWLRFFFVCHP